MDVNTVVLSGRIATDVKPGKTSGGKKKVFFRLAVQKSKEEANFFSVVCYGRTAELVAEYKQKGDPVLIEGALSCWEKKGDGDRRGAEVVEVVGWRVHFLAGAKREDRDRDDRDDRGGRRRDERGGWGGRGSDDDLPF